MFNPSNILGSLQIVEKIKSGEYTQKEVEKILAGDKNLIRWCSDYYKSIQSTNEVRQITTSIESQDDKLEIVTITHNDFEKKIISTEERTETITIEGCTIHIVAPVLVKMERNQFWKGIYTNEPIEFKIEDEEFLKQVYNHEIKFGSGTYITFAISITTHTKIKDDGETQMKHTYVVKEVSKWADDENFQYYTKRYKGKMEESKVIQLSLFNEKDISHAQ